VTVERELAPGEWSVLALLAEVPAHGWALARQMARDGEIGRVWALGRPLVYRALELLEERGLIEPAGSERGVRGPNRTVFRATPEGRAELSRWLEEPVEHVRDVRSLLLLKLVLIDRAGLDRTPLLHAQRDLVVPAVRQLEQRLAESRGSEAIFVRFRLESTRAVVDFIDGLLAERSGAAAAPAS
jgi:DNA-binding PadR family transcriptional regulator